ncbi:MAG TPA: tetratricopeptide repeat protein [Rhizomicrobium sp.]|nr:tetratricopeptide repeat protein [Rhizomicrobium sp.]
MRRAGLIGLGVCVLAALSPALADQAPSDAQGVASALSAGRSSDAEALATKALEAKELDPLDRAHLLLNRALAREQQGSRHDALADFNAALALSVLGTDELPRAYFDRGVTLDELGRTDEAIADYSAALKIAPGFAPALNDRANAERRLGRLPEAKTDYEASLAADNPQKEYPYYGLGQLAEAQGDAADAAADYRLALAANGKYALASQRLAALSAQTSGALHPADSKSPAAMSASYETTAPDLRPAIIDKTVKASRVAMLDAPVKSATGTAQVQLGAFRDAPAATQSWDKMVAAAGGALDGFSPRVVPADIPGKGKFYRLRAGPVDDARALCAKLTAKNLVCIPVKD